MGHLGTMLETNIHEGEDVKLIAYAPNGEKLDEKTIEIN